MTLENLVFTRLEYHQDESSRRVTLARCMWTVLSVDRWFDPNRLQMPFLHFLMPMLSACLAVRLDSSIESSLVTEMISTSLFLQMDVQYPLRSKQSLLDLEIVTWCRLSVWEKTQLVG